MGVPGGNLFKEIAMQYHARCTECGKVEKINYNFQLHRAMGSLTVPLCCGEAMVPAGRLRPGEGDTPLIDRPMLPATILVDEIQRKIVAAFGPCNVWCLEAEMK